MERISHSMGKQYQNVRFYKLVLFNIYIITSEIEFDFDYLGYIDHIHADKQFFETYLKYGEKVIR